LPNKLAFRAKPRLQKVVFRILENLALDELVFSAGGVLLQNSFDLWTLARGGGKGNV
jgi:hypothetical protein